MLAKFPMALEYVCECACAWKSSWKDRARLVLSSIKTAYLRETYSVLIVSSTACYVATLALPTASASFDFRESLERKPGHATSPSALCTCFEMRSFHHLTHLITSTLTSR